MVFVLVKLGCNLFVKLVFCVVVFVLLFDSKEKKWDGDV